MIEALKRTFGRDEAASGIQPFSEFNPHRLNASTIQRNA
jgi:hypothetical protein